MRTRALVLSLFLAGCSSSVTPAIEIRTIPLPAAEDAGEVASSAAPSVDAGASAAEGTDASGAADSDPGDVSNADAAPAAPDAAPAVDAAPAITCREAPLQDNVCKDYGLLHSLMYFCTDGDAGPAACPAPYVLIQYNATGTDYTSQCCTPS